MKIMYLRPWYIYLQRDVTFPRQTNFQFRQIFMWYSSSSRSKNHYDTLGISSAATQSDIKSAYYKLSMQYHPDKNKGSDIAAERFRDITQAYEILGNYRLRKLYDKGIIHITGFQDSRAAHAGTEDDSQTKFYKARMKRSEIPHQSGRTPIYNFDEWSRAHYGQNFERRKAAKEKFTRLSEREKVYKLSSEKEILIFGVLALIVLLSFLGISYSEKTDVDNTKTAKEK